MDGIDDADDNGYHAGVFIFQHLPCAPAFIQHQHGVPYASVCVIQCDKISTVIRWIQRKRLHHELAAVFIRRVADGCDDGTDDFSKDHGFR